VVSLSGCPNVCKVLQSHHRTQKLELTYINPDRSGKLRVLRLDALSRQKDAY